jgi:hypothetical protein
LGPPKQEVTLVEINDDAIFHGCHHDDGYWDRDCFGDGLCKLATYYDRSDNRIYCRTATNVVCRKTLGITVVRTEYGDS